MNRNKMRLFENMIIVTFPLVLFAGCAGSDIKPAAEDKPYATYSEHENPFPGQELMTNSTSYAIEEAMDPVVNDAEQPLTIHEVHDTRELAELSIVETPGNIAQLPSTHILYFDTDHYQLLDEQREILKQHAEFLLAHPGMTLVINGHADVRGTEAYNQVLSEKRAQSVYALLSELGVEQSQLKKTGFGELQPLRDKNQWDENRRVELEFSNPVQLSSME
ncbi:OmpA family protein [Kaarinaea lacus]